MHTPTTSSDRKKLQSQHFCGASTPSSSEEDSSKHEPINTVHSMEVVCAKRSELSFIITDPLSTNWQNTQRRFLLKWPYDFEMETLLQETLSTDPHLKIKTN